MTDITVIETKLSAIRDHIIEMSQNLESDKDSYVKAISEFMSEQGVPAIEVSLLKTKVRMVLEGAMFIWTFMGMVRDALSQSLGYSGIKH